MNSRIGRLLTRVARKTSAQRPFSKHQAAPSGMKKNHWVAWSSLAALAASTVLIMSNHGDKRNLFADEKHAQPNAIVPGEFQEGLPEFSREQVAQHNKRNTRIWVTFKRGVYDITDFVDGHPGGDKILLAAGTSVEPFWAMYGSHLTESTYEILEGMRIGNLKKGEKPVVVDSTDLYANEPERYPILHVRNQKPFNAETPAEILVDNIITPNDLFFKRNHLPVPLIEDEKAYRLEITGDCFQNNKSVQLSLDDLKTKFAQHSVVVTLQCAGNRRNELNKVKPVKGLEWQAGAISTAKFTGVWLRDVLAYAGITDGCGAKHIQFEGVDKDPTKAPYGASITFSNAMDPRKDVLIAFEMNDEKIPRDHGYPLRAIVPGVVGARNVKWLNRIVLSQDESASFWQQNDYKSFNPSADPNHLNWKKAHAIQELPINSSICVPNNNSEIEGDEVLLKGWAYSGGGRKVIRVDISADGGKTWQEADLLKDLDQEDGRTWALTRWEANLPLEHVKHGDEVEICSKAVDSSYNVQPEKPDAIWNVRGVLTNHWHCIKCRVNNE